MRDKDRVRIALILEPLPDSVPWECRVRRALKALLRSYRLRNVLFVPPRALEENPAQWRAVEPATADDRNI